MKKTIFLIKKRNNNDYHKNININPQSNIDYIDEMYLPQPQPNQNNGIKDTKPKKVIFISEKTNNETKDTFSSPLIWNKINNTFIFSQFVILKRIKKDIINFIIIYFNGILELYGFEEKLLPIDDEITEVMDSSYNIKLLNSTLENILTGKIYSKKRKKHNYQHNIKLIKNIYDKNDILIINLISKTFFESLEHFRKSKYIPELIGFELYFQKSIQNLENEGKNKEYIIAFINILKNFEFKFGYKKIIYNPEIIKNDI